MTRPISRGTTRETLCPACGKITVHEVSHRGEILCHLRCQSCGGIHIYVLEGKKLVAIPQNLDAVLYRLEPHERTPYRATVPFRRGEMIAHPTFGTGYVLDCLVPNKMEILFDSGTRVLVCAPGPDHAPPSDPKTSVTATPGKKQRARKTSAGKKAAVAESPSAKGAFKPMAVVECPKCGRTLHPYNLRESPSGEVLGCMHCA